MIYSKFINIIRSNVSPEMDVTLKNYNDNKFAAVMTNRSETIMASIEMLPDNTLDLMMINIQDENLLFSRTYDSAREKSLSEFELIKFIKDFGEYSPSNISKRKLDPA